MIKFISVHKTATNILQQDAACGSKAGAIKATSQPRHFIALPAISSSCWPAPTTLHRFLRTNKASMSIVVLGDREHWHMLKYLRHISLIENQWQRTKSWMSALHLLFLLLCLDSSLWALSAALLSFLHLHINKYEDCFWPWKQQE